MKMARYTNFGAATIPRPFVQHLKRKRVISDLVAFILNAYYCRRIFFISLIVNKVSMSIAQNFRLYICMCFSAQTEKMPLFFSGKRNC